MKEKRYIDISADEVLVIRFKCTWRLVFKMLWAGLTGIDGCGNIMVRSRKLTVYEEGN